MEVTSSDLAPTWVCGDATQLYIGCSSYSLKRYAKEGKLIQNTHYMRMGAHENSKYRFHVANCTEYFKSHSLPARPQKSS